MWDSYDPPFAQYTFINIIITTALLYKILPFSTANILKVALSLQYCCAINVIMQSYTFQRLIHDGFVFFITYSHLCALQDEVRFLGFVFNLEMLYTRWLYDKCIFFPWNTSRNILFDYLAVALLCINFSRRSNWFGDYAIMICLFSGFISHSLLYLDQ